MVPEHTRTYLMHGLGGVPTVLIYLLQSAREADWDRRPDPNRFTLREVVAHLSDWESVWHERFTAMIAQDNPSLQGYDEGQWAIDHDYAHADMPTELMTFSVARARNVELLRGLKPEQWDRPAQHSEWSSITIGSLAALVLGHDGYHMKQVVDWIAAGELA